MKLGMNIDGVQRSNRNLVLRLMLDINTISRVELAKRTGLKKATITSIINEFIDMGIIEESGMIKGEHGRNTSALKLSVPKARVISFRINRKFFEIASYDLHGICQDKIREKIDTNVDIKITFESIKKHLRDLVENIGSDNILGVCVGVPGPFIQNDKNLTIVTGFEQLSRINIKEELEKEYSFPIFIEHDAKIAALAEWKYWCKKNKTHDGTLINIVSIGQGVGAGIIINDKIIKGKLGTAGEIGYMGINYNGPIAECGNRGILENYSSSESIRRHMLDRLNEFKQTELTESSNLVDIYKEYERKNPLAEWAVEKTAWYLGYGIAGLVSVLNPDTVIIGADYPQSQKFIEAVRTTVKELVYAEIYDFLNIEISQVDGSAIILGGYNLVLDRLISSQQILDHVKKIVS